MRKVRLEERPPLQMGGELRWLEEHEVLFDIPDLHSFLFLSVLRLLNLLVQLPDQ